MVLKLSLPPVDTLSGDQLTRELQDAGYRNVAVVQHGSHLVVTGKTDGGSDIDERSRPKVEAVVSAHRYVPLEQQVAELRGQVAALTDRLAYLEAKAVLKP